MDTKEFLNPGSMLTPGMAGGMTMAMTNVLSGQLNITAPGPAYLGLGLSFLFGLLVFVGDEVSWLKRGIYYVLNSLVIFVVAIGSNTVGQGATARPAAAAPAPAAAVSGADLTDWLGAWIPAAQAQTPAASASAAAAPGWCCQAVTLRARTAAACAQDKGRWFDAEPSARAACKAPAAQPADKSSGGFFRPWTSVPRP